MKASQATVGNLKDENKYKIEIKMAITSTTSEIATMCILIYFFPGFFFYVHTNILFQN